MLLCEPMNNTSHLLSSWHELNPDTPARWLWTLISEMGKWRLRGRGQHGGLVGGGQAAGAWSPSLQMHPATTLPLTEQAHHETTPPNQDPQSLRSGLLLFCFKKGHRALRVSGAFSANSCWPRGRTAHMLTLQENFPRLWLLNTRGPQKAANCPPNCPPWSPPAAGG